MYAQGDGFYSIGDVDRVGRIAVLLTKEQAEEIVRAVNSFQELVNALERVKLLCESNGQLGLIRIVADETLKLAKGE